ncbi:MAG TPA: 50S ribosomal protein L24 [Candidatus Vogelbacteria bacterium]|nr:50S ribosomal protein L24 [Candidatus Vogelbacteria bacterium]
MSTKIIKKGDTVQILTGEDKGKSGKVLKVFRTTGLVLVEGLNLKKRRIRPKRAGEKGQTVEVATPLAISNLALFCKTCKRGKRIKVQAVKDKKIRVCTKCSNPF